MAELSSEKYLVLMVDDSEDDCLLIKRAIGKADRLLLDLKMPRKNGFEVLEWLQSQPFENMVVVVLSGSEQREDVTKAMNLGAHYYHVKHADSHQRSALIKLLEQYFDTRLNLFT